MTHDAFILGTQYFRPPFPQQRHWEDDLRAMADAGLNAVQAWMVWGWVEPEPGRYVFDDYDRLAELAGRHGLGLVLSVLPEVNPFWLPRLHPDSLMIDLEGRPVPGCNRGECISGLVPGSCSDHPEIRRLMEAFLTACGEHFAPCGHLVGWDAWNENRWRNFAPGVVCQCPHSLAGIHAFLDEKYGSPEALGEAWGRRYTDWRDVRIGRLLGNSYPEWKDFTEWLCRRGEAMIRWRVEAIRRGDPHHPVSSHTGSPTIFGGVNLNENIYSRGIDWDIASGDSYGFSSFPASALADWSLAEFCVRVSSCLTAGGGKPVWMSELQGGPTAHSRRFGRPLPGAEQQAWIWIGISRGIRAAILWCWRPEVFGNECNGFGFLGPDGLADDRRRAMQATAGLLREHASLLAGYRPDPPEVAVVFQRDTYLYDWLAAQHLKAPCEAPGRFLAWPLALEEYRLPYDVLDDRHLPPAAAHRLIVVPDAAGLADAAVDWLLDRAAAGATVVVEGAAGAFGPDSYWRGLDERPLYQRLGVTPVCERRPAAERFTIPAGLLGNAAGLDLPAGRWELTLDADGSLASSVPHGRGRVVLIGTSCGPANGLLSALAALAGVAPPVKVDALPGSCTASTGLADGQRLTFLVNGPAAQAVTVDLPATVSDWFAHDLRPTPTGLAIDLDPHAVVVLG